MESFQFAIVGLAAGAAYGLTALGLVVIYRGSSVINFAHGAFAAVAAYTYWWLANSHGVPWFPAMCAAVIVAAMLGAATHLVVMRPMRLSSSLTRTIATLGVLIVIQAVLVLITPPEVLSVRSFLPKGGIRLGDIVFGYDRMIISAITLFVCAGLVWLSRRTRFGLATSAAAENRRSAAALGHSPDMIATVNWALGSALAGLAAVLLTPILGLQITTMTALTFPCLAAAVVGRLSSFAPTVAAGFALGIAESLTTKYVSNPGWSSAIPFIVILVVMVLRDRAIPSRGEIRDRLPAIGSGRIQPWVIAVVALVAVFAIWGPAEFTFIDAMTVTLGISIVVLSQILVTGYAGQLSLCQMTMAGTGAIVAGRTMATWGWPFELAAPVAMIAAFVLGILVGIPALRTRGIGLAVLTMGFAVAMQALFFGGTLAGVGVAGDNVGSRTLFGIDIDALVDPRRYATFALVAFLVATIAVANIRRSQSGRRMIAVRESERAARALGINVYSTKLFAFALGGAIAAGGGIVLAYRNPILTYNTGYDYTQSLTLLADSVVGGLGSVAGAFVGTAALQPGGVIYSVVAGLFAGRETLFVLIGGVGLIYVLWDAADGLVLTFQSRIKNTVQKFSRVNKEAAAPRSETAHHQDNLGQTGPNKLARSANVPSAARVRPVTLRVRDLTVRYGGVTAVDSVSLEVAPGEVLGIIGPNGAGKTSLIDAITGFTSMSGGAVHLNDAGIESVPAHKRSSMGLGRSFQSLELFEDFTVRENLLTACDRWSPRRFITDMIVPSRGSLTPGALQAVEQFGLHSVLDVRINELPYGLRRLCAAARAVAAEPSILLLDEPAAGLGDEESDELARHIRQLADERGMGILLIEHNLDLVMSVSDRLLALDFGKLISSGSPAEVRADPKVAVAYLGIEIGQSEGDVVVDSNGASL